LLDSTAAESLQESQRLDLDRAFQSVYQRNRQGTLQLYKPITLHHNFPYLLPSQYRDDSSNWYTDVNGRTWRAESSAFSTNTYDATKFGHLMEELSVLNRVSVLSTLQGDHELPAVPVIHAVGWRALDSLEFSIVSEREEVYLLDLIEQLDGDGQDPSYKHLLLSRCFSTVFATLDSLHKRHQQVITKVDLRFFAMRSGWQDGFLRKFCTGAAVPFEIDTSGWPNYGSCYTTLGDSYVALLLCLCGLENRQRYEQILGEERQLPEAKRLKPRPLLNKMVTKGAAA
jgi:hypothetical protein